MFCFKKHTKHKSSNNEKGIGLIETIAAMGVAMIIVTSIVSLSVYTLRASTTSKLMIMGSKYATEELERLRAKRDTTNTWLSFYNSVVPACDTVGEYCYINSSLGIAQAVSTTGEVINTGGGENMRRYFWVTNPNGGGLSPTQNILRFNVRVTWVVGGQTKNTYIYTDLSNWRNL
jgi:hypothetical protein